MQAERGAGRMDHLQRHLNALRSPDELRRDGDRSLADYVEAERRDLDSEAFALLDKEIHERISNMARRCAGAQGLRLPAIGAHRARGSP